jgi:hypothetical protein
VRYFPIVIPAAFDFSGLGSDSGGYTTQFILFSGQVGQSSSGTMQFFSQTGGAWNLTLQ